MLTTFRDNKFDEGLKEAVNTILETQGLGEKDKGKEKDKEEKK